MAKAKSITKTFREFYSTLSKTKKEQFSDLWREGFFSEAEEIIDGLFMHSTNTNMYEAMKYNFAEEYKKVNNTLTSLLTESYKTDKSASSFMSLWCSGFFQEYENEISILLGD